MPKTQGYNQLTSPGTPPWGERPEVFITEHLPSPNEAWATTQHEHFYGTAVSPHEAWENTRKKMLANMLGTAAVAWYPASQGEPFHKEPVPSDVNAPWNNGEPVSPFPPIGGRFEN